MEEALERLAAEGVTDLLVQPTHMMMGGEFRKAEETLRAYRDRFARVALGAPLLTSRKDLSDMAGVLMESFSGLGDNELLALMGHGSAEADPNPYILINEDLKAGGCRNILIGTVEFEPGFSPILDSVMERRPARVFLAPFMVVAGDHANNDMAGDEDSWASRLKARGFETECILRGLGEYPAVQAMYVSHAREAADL